MMKKNEIILVLGTLVGYIIVCFSSNSTTILQLFGLIIGMAIVAGTAAYYGGKRTIECNSLNSMQEESAKDLEEAAKHYLYSNILYDDVYVGNPTEKDCIEMFKAGAKWQKEHMLNDAIKATAHPEDYELWCDMSQANLKDGQEVKAILIKEDNYE